MGIDIICYPDGMYGENTYLITDQATGFKAIIDPGYYGVDVRMDIQNNAYLKYVLLTHGHHDHFLEAKEYVDEYSAVRFAAPEKDIALIHDHPYPCPEPTMVLHDGDVITLGETKLRVIETPGHTGGGVCFATDKEILHARRRNGRLSGTRRSYNNRLRKEGKSVCIGSISIT